MNEAHSTAPALEKGLMILGILSRNSCSFSELSRLIGCGSSSLNRFLKTLQQYG
ncbi:MAG: helix-turn-helix domain-containing protein, partial [Planctomycetes bacterium]|nr:helix-turn-helix domain-containing protein [Planctomycetota bacterium]